VHFSLSQNNEDVRGRRGFDQQTVDKEQVLEMIKSSEIFGKSSWHVHADRDLAIVKVKIVGKLLVESFQTRLETPVEEDLADVP
jgi:hypothetical protein